MVKIFDFAFRMIPWIPFFAFFLSIFYLALLGILYAVP